MSKYLELSEEINALDSLDKAHFFITRLKDDEEINWKWTILCSHSALYGFAICALKGTDNVRVCGKDGRLIDFCETIKRIQKEEFMRMTVGSKWITLSLEQLEDIKKFHNTFRNNFEHYKPKGWLIETSGMPRIINSVLDIIHFLATESGNYVNINGKEKEMIEYLIASSKKILEEIGIIKDNNLIE